MDSPLLSIGAPPLPIPGTDTDVPGALPIRRIDGRWHLTVGSGHVPIEDDALTRDQEALAALLTPAASPGRRP
ncbi:hypothetical protein ABZX85_39510 [Streptomyces sp. NPDC004539]|uniref:hypothetical protein n=1 Tax=Streptomyces sp. NPDC004539 TaxID=3154280 RepID=UPI0033B163B6